MPAGDLEGTMDEKISLTFTENSKYQLEFWPPDFWIPFAVSYDAIPWTEQSSKRIAIVAENYTYLLDMLVQARLFYMNAKSIAECNK